MHAFEDLGGHEGFFEDALDHAALGVVELVGVACHDEDGDEGVDCAEAFERGRAVFDWHEEVEEDEVEAVFGEEFEASFAVGGGVDFVTADGRQVLFQEI